MLFYAQYVTVITGHQILVILKFVSQVCYVQIVAKMGRVVVFKVCD